MSIHERPAPQPMVGDLDDHRPGPRWGTESDPPQPPFDVDLRGSW